VAGGEKQVEALEVFMMDFESGTDDRDALSFMGMQ
jgi:hypothetical protein